MDTRATQHPTTQYATDVVYGDMVACKWVKLACQRHLRDLERSRTDPGYQFVFDETRADRLFDFFRMCRHVRGPAAGQPIELNLWEKFAYGCVFGWVHRDSGKRRFKTAYIRVARGNNKSTGMSGIANYGMVADVLYEPGQHSKTALHKYEAKPEVVCGAVDKEQAAIVWGDAREMALSSPEIAKRLRIQKTAIGHKKRGGKLVKLSKDTKNKDGGAPCIIIIDEYHAHPTSLVKDVTSSGKGKRSQCLEMIITTAGEDAENKPCKKEDDIVKKILEGTIPNDTYFAIIYEIDAEDDPHDEACWVKANPIFATDTEYSRTLRDQVKEEHDLAYSSNDNAKKRQWLIKRVNRWQYDAEERYMGGYMDRWRTLAVSRDKFLEIVKGKDVTCGVDLSKCMDLTAVGWVFSLGADGYAVCAHGFVPENTAIAHEKGDRVPYRDWAADGWCTLTPGDVTDDRPIIQHVQDAEVAYGWRIQELCYDPYAARQFANVMQDDGYKCIEVRQGVQTLSEPTKRFREAVVQRKIVHDGSPLLTWCVANAVEIIDSNGNIKLSKKHKDDSQRIDCLAAIINAFTRASVAEECVYNSRGMRAL